MRELSMLDNSKDTLRNSVNSKGSIAVVGIVKDIESSIEQDISRLTKAFSGFDEIEWLVVESGSSDRSLEKLQEIARKNVLFDFVGIPINVEASRTENMAEARNRYLEYLRNDNYFKKFKYVVVADFNNLNSKLTSSAVETCFRRDDWDVVTANQSGRYYDVWALRHPLWSPNDCWDLHSFYRRYMKFPESAVTYSFRARMIKIPKKSEWIEVDSAFGGLAIYKSHLLASNANYVGVTKDGKQVCEHVLFHAGLKKSGAKIFINPALINTRTTDHSKRLSLPFTLMRILRYPLNYLRSFK